jgi:WD40 repeat protein
MIKLKSLNFWLALPLKILIILLAFSLASCGAPEAAAIQATAPATTAPTLTFTPRPTRTPTLTPTPTVTPTPTPTATPTALLLAQTGTPLPDTLPILTEANAPQASGLAAWKETSGVSDIAWSPDGKALAVAGSRTISLVDPLTRSSIQSLDAGQGLTTIAFSPDGAWLAAGNTLKSTTGTEYSILQLWRGPDWKPRGNLFTADRGVSQVAFAPKTNIFAAAFSGPEIKNNSFVDVWSTATWEITRTLQLGTSLNIAFSPDSQLLASVPDRYATRLWQMDEGKVSHNLLTAFTDAVSSLAFSPDSTTLATGHYDGSIRLWNVSSGDLIRSMNSEGAVSGVAFSPDGSLLVTGDSFGDSAVRIWSAKTGGLLRTLEGHTRGVNQILFSPDGRLLVSASYDGSVRLWGIRP